jgi:hypothetical protein
MSTDLASGCRCKRCEANQPHAPVDELLILKALGNDPPVCGPTKRRLAFYDSKRKPGFGGNTSQPWDSRPARRAA